MFSSPRPCSVVCAGEGRRSCSSSVRRVVVQDWQLLVRTFTPGCGDVTALVFYVITWQTHVLPLLCCVVVVVFLTEFFCAYMTSATSNSNVMSAVMPPK